jgi:cation diffusion facilitator family transporter
MEARSREERRTLRLLLAINAAMFVVEAGAGLLARSSALLADSLDMFADAAVYGVSLWAVGRAAVAKVSAARLSGLLQVLLALFVLGETLRRALAGGEPRSALMMGVGLVALAANAACLSLLWRHREGDVHMRASYIFSANDVVANLAVVLAGLLVRLTGSPLPDLVTGLGIAALVLSGGARILREARREAASPACGAG